MHTAKGAIMTGDVRRQAGYRIEVVINHVTC